MSNTNDTSKLGHAKLEDRALADIELGAVTGGTKAKGSDSSWFVALAKAMGQAADAHSR
jgi:hypothetical protein